MKYSITNNVLEVKQCEECSDLSHFNANYHIDANDPQLSNRIVKWKRYEYFDYTPITDSTETSRKIYLVEIDISLTYFMNLFRDQIYDYIKHSHSARRQELQLKQSWDVFRKGTILSIVDFAENYTFTLQKEIHSEFYHSDQVSILVHIMYRHAELDVNGFDSNENNHEVIKEYHFYISDDRTHDTCFV